MPGKVGFRVRTGWRRPDAALLARFGTASSAHVADCMSRLGAMDAGIRPVWRSPRIIGSALTVWCHSGDNLMLHKALDLAVPGDIVVMNTQGNNVSAAFGELLASSAVKIGIRGIIVDGVVRDADALERLALPVYSRGLCPNSCHKDGPGEVGAIVACGGVAAGPRGIITARRRRVTGVPPEHAPRRTDRSPPPVRRGKERRAP